MSANGPHDTITFRLYRPEDYDGFLACINDFYHGGYPYKEFLDPRFLERECETGNMILTVATDADGQIVGTSAARRASGAFEGSVLLLLRCVLAKCRGMGIGSRQELFLLEQIRERFSDALSLYADVMTHDPVSQITLGRNGFALCGLRMMLYKNEIMVPALPFEKGTKMTQAIYCKAITESPVTLYELPAERERIDAIYAELGVTHTYLPDEGVATAYTVFSEEASALHQKSEFVVETVGEDLSATLMPVIRRRIDEGYTMVVYLNLCHTGCVAAEATLKAAGFLFSGIKPLSAHGEYAVFSHIRNCVRNFEYIKLPADRQKFLDDIVGGMKHEG